MSGVARLCQSVLFSLLLLVCFELCSHQASGQCGPGSQDRQDKLALYKVILRTYWSRARFPRHYPEWRPPAQFGKLVGKLKTKTKPFSTFVILLRWFKNYFFTNQDAVSKKKKKRERFQRRFLQRSLTTLFKFIRYCPRLLFQYFRRTFDRFLSRMCILPFYRLFIQVQRGWNENIWKSNRRMNFRWIFNESRVGFAFNELINKRSGSDRY